MRTFVVEGKTSVLVVHLDTKGSGEHLEMLLLVRMDVQRVAAEGRRSG
ncbi:MAG TPA: hypothetical protein VKA20_09200 [Rubrobacter sp.]|nr:hypothetical protein [Rubrobacter sp.]